MIKNIVMLSSINFFSNNIKNAVVLRDCINNIVFPNFIATKVFQEKKVFQIIKHIFTEKLYLP